MTCRESADPEPRYRPCAGIYLLNRSGQVLIAERLDLPGAWQMPQGGIDAGETPAAAALREMREEIGTDRAVLLRESALWRTYDFPRAIAGRAWAGRWLGQTQKWLAFRFEGEDAEIDLATPHPEFRAWRWSVPDAVPSLAVAFKRAVYVSVVAEFRPLSA